jgi:hypothetical protein
MIDGTLISQWLQEIWRKNEIYWQKKWKSKKL